MNRTDQFDLVEIVKRPVLVLVIAIRRPEIDILLDNTTVSTINRKARIVSFLQAEGISTTNINLSPMLVLVSVSTFDQEYILSDFTTHTAINTKVCVLLLKGVVTIPTVKFNPLLIRIVGIFAPQKNILFCPTARLSINRELGRIAFGQLHQSAVRVSEWAGKLGASIAGYQTQYKQ